MADTPRLERSGNVSQLFLSAVRAWIGSGTVNVMSPWPNRHVGESVRMRSSRACPCLSLIVDKRSCRFVRRKHEVPQAQ